MNGLGRALDALEVAWTSDGEYDKSFFLYKYLSHWIPLSSIYCGRCGDVRSLPLNELPLGVDGLVSGPPCPPWSCIGKKLSEPDARSDVFLTVMMWVRHLVEHGALSVFVLENVVGIMHKRNGADTSFGDWVLSELRSCIPRG